MLPQSVKSSTLSIKPSSLEYVAQIVDEVQSMYEIGGEIISIIENQNLERKMFMFKKIKPLLDKIDDFMPKILQICSKKDPSLVIENSNLISKLMKELYVEIGFVKKSLI